MKRGNLVADHLGEEGYVLMREGEEEGLTISAAELRWLVQAAGPALLCSHDPLPTPAESRPSSG